MNSHIRRYTPGEHDHGVGILWAIIWAYPIGIIIGMVL